MPAAKRGFEPCVIERLLLEPQRFEFTQAVRMLDLWLRREGVPHEQVLTRYLRFKNSLSLSFPPSQIEAILPEADAAIGTAAALRAALRTGRLTHIHITPAFMGLLGISGVLPLRYTERVATQFYLRKNEGPRAFFDSFSNRSLALFYQAWAAYRVQYRVDTHGRDGFLPLQLALAGVRPASPRPVPSSDEAEADAIGREVAAHYAAMLRHRPVSAEVMAGVLGEYFGVPFTLVQFVGGWDPVPLELRTRVGVANCTVGVDAMLGARCWRRDLRVRLRIGPLAKQDYDRFLPGASGYLALKAMVALFASADLHFEVQLVLRGQDVRGACLWSSKVAGGVRLGWDAFVSPGPGIRDRDDLCFDLDR